MFASTRTSQAQPRGATLPELLLVTAILVVLGSAVLPRIQATQLSRLDLAAELVAHAVRFARDEARRTGVRHMVAFDSANHVLLVAELNTVGPPASPLPLARHPTSRQPYRLDLDDDAALAPVTIAQLTLSYQGSGSQAVIDFDSSGVPHYQSLGAKQRMLSASISLALGGAARTITVAPLTGMVSITGGAG